MLTLIIATATFVPIFCCASGKSKNRNNKKQEETPITYSTSQSPTKTAGTRRKTLGKSEADSLMRKVSDTLFQEQAKNTKLQNTQSSSYTHTSFLSDNHRNETTSETDEQFDIIDLSTVEDIGTIKLISKKKRNSEEEKKIKLKAKMLAEEKKKKEDLASAILSQPTTSPDDTLRNVSSLQKAVPTPTRSPTSMPTTVIQTCGAPRLQAKSDALYP